MEYESKLQKMKDDLAQTGSFLIDGEQGTEELLEKVLPGNEYLGSIRDLLGYEPDNYLLLGALEHDDNIYTIFDAGNQWTGIGLLDESKHEDSDFANEIRAGVVLLKGY